MSRKVYALSIPGNRLIAHGSLGVYSSFEKAKGHWDLERAESGSAGRAWIIGTLLDNPVAGWEVWSWNDKTEQWVRTEGLD